MDAGVSRYLGAGGRTLVITGDVPWLVEREAREVATWASQWAQPVAMNVTIVQASEKDAPAEFSSVVTATPSLAYLRVVQVRGMHDATDAMMERLVAYVGKPANTTVLVASGRATPAVRKGGTAWGQRLAKAVTEGKGHWHKVADGVDPGRFVHDMAAASGKRLAHDAARALIEVVGVDLGTLAAEVEKLASYVGDEPEIRAEHVVACGTMLAEADVFALTGAIVSHDLDVALATLTRLVEDEAPEKLMRTIEWQVRTVLLVQDMRQAGKGERAIREAVRMPGHAWDRIRSALDKGAIEPAAAMERLARTGRALHRHRAGERLVLERLVLDLCRG